MPVAKKVALTEVTEGRPVRARNTRVSVTAEESDDDDFVDAKPKAKATSKATSAVKKSGATKASKKRAHEDEEDVDFESDLSPTKKAKVVVAEVLQEEPKPKKAGPKKPAAAKKDDDEGSADEEAAVAVVPTDFSTPTLAPGELKIVSWNVAGYRAILKKGFEEYIKSESPDIIALQESKVPSDREKMFAGYHTYFFGCEAKSGLHGTALLSKIKPINVKFLEDYDKEGRVIVAEFDSFYLLNTYVPNSGQKLERLDFRIEWDKKLQALFLELQGKKPVIWCGDLNVAKDAIDLTNPTTNKRTAGFTQRERDSFNGFLTTNGLVDTYRKRNELEKDCYTFWTYRGGARAKNIGWRMDYFIVSPTIDNNISHSYIRKHIVGSDHCPIVIHLKA